MARTPPVRTPSPKVRVEPQRRRRRPASVEVLHPARNASPRRQDGAIKPLAYLASLILRPLQQHFARVTVEARWRSQDFGATQVADALPEDLVDRDDAAAEHAAALDRHWAVATMIAAAGLAVVVSVIVAPRLRDAAQPAYPQSSAMMQQGAAVYASSCAGCHGAERTGSVDARGLGPPPLDATGHAWLHSDTSLFRMVKFGIADCQPGTAQGRMPGFKEQLDDRSIHAALTFIKSSWPAALRDVQNAFNDGESDAAETQEAVLCTAICQPPSPGAAAR